VRFLATSQNIDADESNPTSKLILWILAAVAELDALDDQEAREVRDATGKRTVMRMQEVRCILWLNRTNRS
jgi:hypothetical protein